MHEGSELTKAFQYDMVSPLQIGRPKARRWSKTERPRQTCAFVNLPSHVHAQMALHLLGLSETDLSFPPYGFDQTTRLLQQQRYLLPSDGVKDVLALARSSVGIDIPLAIWRTMLLDDINKFKLLLLRGWSGAEASGGPARFIHPMWSAITEAFSSPVDLALDHAQRVRQMGHDNESGVDETAPAVRWDERDVWQWWKYGEGWRSRRRVWYCVVHACATTRHVDWW